MDARAPKAGVRAAYDALSYRYRADDAAAEQYEPWLDVVRERLRPGSAVLDLGCGCGVRGHHLLLRADPCALAGATALARPARKVAATGRNLSGDGRYSAWTGAEDSWLGGEAAMWWSHADANTYRGWLAHAGLVIVEEKFVPEGTGGHLFVAAERR